MSLLHKIGLGGILRFDSSQAEAAMGRTGKAFAGLRQRGMMLSRGFSQASMAMMGMGMAMTPIVNVTKNMAKTFANFDAQMSSVRAVSLNATTEQMKAMRDEAKRLGASTSFTATESGKGMENLGRAGFSAGARIASLGTMLRLAEADNLSLDRATTIAADTMSMFGLRSEDAATQAAFAARVTNTFANIAASTNTDANMLGEGMKFAGVAARGLGLDVEQTSSLLGVLADNGLKAGMGGRNLNAMFEKMKKPSGTLNDIFKKFNFEVTELRKGGAAAEAEMDKLFKGFSQLTAGDQIKMLNEFGTRGGKAFQILANKGTAEIQRLTEASRKAADSNLVETMAKTQLDNFKGQMKLLKSAWEGFSIEVFENLGGLGKDAIGDLAKLLGGVVQVLQGADDIEIMEALGIDQRTMKMIRAFGDGVIDGLNIIGNTIDWLRRKFQEGGGIFEEVFGAEGLRSIAKFGVILGGLATILAPLMLALGGVAFLVSTVLIPGFVALKTAMMAALWPVALVVGVIAAAFFALRNENESFFDWAARMWEGIKQAGLDFWQNVLKPLWEGLKEGYEIIWPELKAAGEELFKSLRGLVSELMRLWSDLFGDSTVEWKLWANVAVQVIGTIVKFLTRVLMTAINAVRHSIAEVRQAFIDFGSGNTMKGIARLGKHIINVLLAPVRSVAGLIGQMLNTLADIPGIGDEADKLRKRGASLTDFAEKGFSFGMDDAPLAKDRFDTFGLKEDGFSSEPGAMGELFTEDPNFQPMQEVLQSLPGEVSKGVKEGFKDTKIENNIESSVCLDGKTVGRNQARNQQDLADRMGFQTPPFIRRVSAEQGTLPPR